MVFLGIYTALYDYEPQGDNELSIREGEILYVIEKSDVDDWWKAKKRATAEDEEEPVGLIPNNYVEEVSETSMESPASSELPGRGCCYFVVASTITRIGNFWKAYNFGLRYTQVLMDRP